jgi:hypothetical protein
MTYSKSHTEDAQMLGATVQHLFASANWRLVFMHICKYRCTTYVCVLVCSYVNMYVRVFMYYVLSFFSFAFSFFISFSFSSFPPSSFSLFVFQKIKLPVFLQCWSPRNKLQNSVDNKCNTSRDIIVGIVIISCYEPGDWRIMFWFPARANHLLILQCAYQFWGPPRHLLKR